MSRWWHADTAPQDGGDAAFLVVEAKCVDPSRRECDALQRCSVLVSNAMRDILVRVAQHLTIERDASDETKVASADLACTVSSDHAVRIAALLAQVKRNKRTGAVLPFSNAYRFTACTPIAGTDTSTAVARLARGEWRERRGRGGDAPRVHALDCIPATTGLQQLLATYVVPDILQTVPSALRAGVCQEVAQQVMSYIGQLESSRVRGEVAFPTVEDRDPVRRRLAYTAAIDRLVHDLTPFSYAKVRDKYPGQYADDDPRGDRMIVDDERWFAVTTTPDPHPIPLLFVQGDAVRLLTGSMQFDAGVSKRNRHRGRIVPRDDVRAARPAAVQRKGSTGLSQWYAAVPLLDGVDSTLATIADAAPSTHGRRLDLGLRPLPITGTDRWRMRRTDLLLRLSGDRKRLTRVLSNPHFRIAWSRLVQKRDDWFLQLTVRIPTPAVADDHRVLGVSFGIDAVATWELIGADGASIVASQLAPNEQILAFLREKRGVEWDQEKGRWVGGRRFAKQLESIAHSVANELIALAETHRAVLAVEDVSWVQKAGPNHEQNVLFTAWNFGQLRRILAYKSALAGRGDPVTVSDYIVSYTCRFCLACRTAKQTPAEATTWREGTMLHCRSCGLSGVVSPFDRALRVAQHGFARWQTRWQRLHERRITALVVASVNN